MAIKRSKDTSVKKVIQHRIADKRGGVGVKTAELGGDYLFEGTPVGAVVNGQVSVLKFAKLVTAATNSTTAYEVEKGHHFKVGNVVLNAEGAKAYTITAIDKSNADKDVITLGTTLGVVIPVGGFLIEAAAESATTTSAVKFAPKAINGTNQKVLPNENLFTDIWDHAQLLPNTLPSVILDKLKGITEL
jgi:hypothetical protein